MRYGQIRNYDVANGQGVRVTLFVTGCHFHCYNCFNPEYQDFDYGKEFDDDSLDYIIKLLESKQIHGFSVLGGEPMEHQNYLTYVLGVIRKHLREDQDIWMWTGYTFEDVLLDSNKRKLVEKVDVLVDGQFKDELLDLTLAFRGSSNQRIIDVQESLNKQEVVLHKDYVGR